MSLTNIYLRYSALFLFLLCTDLNNVRSSHLFCLCVPLQLDFVFFFAFSFVCVAVALLSILMNFVFVSFFSECQYALQTIKYI